MTTVRIPRWWLAVGSERARPIRALFAEVIDGSPIPGRELAEHFEVTPATVSRWAHDQSTPDLQTMREAVDIVQARLAALLERANVAQRVLAEVQAADEAYQTHGFGAELTQHTEALAELLEEARDE